MSSKAFQNADKLNGIVSVLQFGAVGDGAADDTAAIRAAILFLQNNLNVTGISFPSGIYKITSSLPNLSRSNYSITGENSILKIDFSSGNCFSIGVLSRAQRSSGITVKGIRFQSSVARTSGSAILLYSIENVLIENVSFENQYIGILADFYQYVKISNCDFLENQIGVDVNFGDGFYFDNIRMNGTLGATYAAGRVGVYLRDGGGFSFSNVDITRVEWGIAVIPANSTSNIGYIFLSTTALDSCNNGLYVNASAGGNIRHIQADASCWFGSNVSHGIYANKADVLNVCGSTVVLNKNHGIFLSNCRQVNIVGACIAFNNVLDSPVGSGVYAVGTSGLNVKACLFLNTPGFYSIGVYNQKHGVYLDSGMDGYILVDNTFESCILEDIKVITNPSLNCKIKNNRTSKSPTHTAASTISPEIVFDEIFLVGNTTVNSITTPRIPFKELTIITTGNITITKSSTDFALTSNYVATSPYSTLTVISNNGTSWSEKCRAIL